MLTPVARRPPLSLRYFRMAQKSGSRVAPFAAASLLLFCAAAFAVAPSLVVDGDGDGVSDERDDCPYSRAAEVVNADGCSLDGDADSDGVADLADLCPYSATGARVDDEGCSLDDDFDGIANGRDACPDTAIGERVDTRGCDPAGPAKGRTTVAGVVPPVTPATARIAIVRAPLAAIPVATRAPDAGTASLPLPAVLAENPPVAPKIALPLPAAAPEPVAPPPAAAPVARRLPSAPQIVLTPDELQTIDRRLGPAGPNTLRLPLSAPVVEPRS